MPRKHAASKAKAPKPIGTRITPEGVVPDGGADAGLEGNPVASVVLHSVAFDYRRGGFIGVIPNAVSEVVMHKVITEDDAN